MKNKRDRISDNPRKLPFELIKLITNDFSEELGRGAFGQVFKGVLEDEEVAVKMLHFMPNINDQHFENEFEILKGLEHPNIVRLLGFCDEAKEEFAEYNGKLIVCQRIHKALCLEYMPKGSLGKLLSGENLGKNWPIRYKIIKGICEGLKYLQEELEFPIFHFDLKPDNILLNENMIPKISDFGLSRLIGEENTKRTLTPLGTIGYLPPEFINYQIISKEYDIYSLGVIITKIITGTTGYSDVADMGAEEFVEHVHENWKKCLQEIPKYESLEVDCKQVKRCIEIARKCMENDRRKRPTIKDIVSQLDEMENFILHSQLPMEKGLPQTTGWVVPVPNRDWLLRQQSISNAQLQGSPHGMNPKRQWLAEGFVRPTNLCTDLAAENLEKLLDQNIIEPIDGSNNTNVKACKTYGMMHEYITLKSLDENFINLLDGGQLQHKNVRRVSLCQNTITDGSTLNIDLPLVRSLEVLGEAGEAMLNFINYKQLMFLDLENCTDLQDDHLTEICNLFRLKYLSLGGNVTILPKEIKQLKLLETLDLRRTNVRILPTEVVQLPHLKHLFGKVKLPDKAMHELQKFHASAKCKLQTLAGFLVDESDGFAELMGHMKKLRKVKIWCESSATRRKLTTLQKAIQEFIHDDKDASNDPRSLSLHLDGCSEDFLKELKAPCYLRSLKLQGKLLELPGFVTALRGLRELCLQSVKLTTDLLSALINLKHLWYLKLIADELEEITMKNNALPRLLHLCLVLQRPTFPKIEEGALPFLESLQLLCKDMDGLSGIQIKGFTGLTEVVLDSRITSGTKADWVRAAEEHPRKPEVLFKRAVPPQVYLGGASASFGKTENETINCSVLSEGQVQETDTQMPHDEPSNIGYPVVCAVGSSIAGNGTMAS